MRQVCDEDRCVVAHGFEEAAYRDAQEVVWLVAEIEAKLEVEAELGGVWLDRLDMLARTAGFKRYQVWLISNEGFSIEANNLIRRRAAFTSNRLQLELLFTRLSETRLGPAVSSEDSDELLMVLPMRQDNELIPPSTVAPI